MREHSYIYEKQTKVRLRMALYLNVHSYDNIEYDEAKL